MAYSPIYQEFIKTYKKNQNKTAICYFENEQILSLTYSDLHEKSLKIANLLQEIGIKNQEKVAILLGNQWYWPVSFLAIQYISAVCVPIDIKSPVAEIKKLVEFASAKLIICNNKLYHSIKDTFQNHQFIIIDQLDFNTLKLPPIIEDKQSNLDDITAMFYTSGTLESSKGVLLTNKNLLSNFDSIKNLGLTSEKDNFISLLPLHHTYSFMVTCLLPLLQGGQISYAKGLASEELIECLTKNKVSVFTGVPQLFILLHKSISEKINNRFFLNKLLINFLIEFSWGTRKLTKFNLSKILLNKLHQKFGPDLKYMVSGGAALNEKIIKDFYKWGFTILQGYGLTETSPVVTFNTPKKFNFKSAGYAVTNVNIKIINPDKLNRGQIAIRGNNVMAGYYNMPHETANVLKNGWLLTSDIGYIDKNGFLFIIGRKDELIVLTNGEKVNPEELEKTYIKSEYIKEICIFSLDEKSKLREGSKLMAIIVADEDHFKAQNQANIEEKIKWELENISQQLNVYRRISGYYITTDSLPKTALGKLKRYQIKETYLKKISNLETEPSEKSITDEDQIILSNKATQQIIEYISKRTNKKVGLNDHFELDLGLDSLSRIEILMDIQKMLGIEVSDELAMDLFYTSTIKGMLKKMQPLLPKELSDILTEKFDWKINLNQTVPIEIKNFVKLNFNIIEKLANFVLLGFFFTCFRILFLLKVTGKSNLPKTGPCIIYANHTSYFDGLIIAASLPPNLFFQTYFLGFKKIFEKIYLRQFTKLARLIPIDINIEMLETMKACAYLLKNNKIICLFPEGQRSINTDILPFKKGIGILTKELEIPLIPVYIEGAYKSWPRNKLLPKPAKLKVYFGQQTSYNDVSKNLQDNSYENIAAILREKLIQVKNSTHI